MKKENKQTADNAFVKALKKNIQGTRPAIRLIARIVSALLKTGTSDSVKIAVAFLFGCRSRGSLSAALEKADEYRREIRKIIT